MSISPGFQPAAGNSQGISDVVSQQDLTTWAQIAGVARYLTAPLDEAPAPTAPITLGSKLAENTFKNLYAQLRAIGIPVPFAYLWAAFWAAFMAVAGPLASFLATVLSLILTPVGIGVLEGLGDLRQGIDPAVGLLAQEVLTEFLGVEVGTQNLPMGIGGPDHIARATAIGQLLYNQLESEFLGAAGGSVQPSIAPAQTFSGLAVNFGLASGIMGLIGGLIPYGHVDEIRELGEEVARNIGLGRLVRRALTPLIDTLVSKPAQWSINTKYLPTQFSEPQLVNPYASTTLQHDQLYSAMHLLGYSDDKIAAFIEMHEKKLTPRDVQTLINWGFWTAQDGANYIARQGWPAGFAGNVLLLEGFREVAPWITKEIDLLLTEVDSGQITVSEFAQTIDQFAISQPEKDVLAAFANYRAAKNKHTRPARLSGGELFAAFAAGLITTADLTTRWTAQGLTQDDQDIRLQLWLLHLDRLHELETRQQELFQEKQKAFLEKQGGQKAGPLVPIPPVPPFPLG
jgi:hypothetical protein